MLGKVDCHISVQERFIINIFLPKSSYFDALNFSRLINIKSKIHPTRDGRISLVIQDSDWLDGRF